MGGLCQEVEHAVDSIQVTRDWSSDKLFGSNEPSNPIKVMEFLD